MSHVVLINRPGREPLVYGCDSMEAARRILACYNGDGKIRHATTLERHDWRRCLGV